MTTNITYRESATPTIPGATTTKGTPLTNLEVDANFKTIADDLNLKATLAGPTFTGTVVLPSTTSIGLVTAAEIGYVDGVTSAIQPQIDAKSPLASPTFTGTPIVPTAAIGTNTTQAASTAFVNSAAQDVALAMAIALS